LVAFNDCLLNGKVRALVAPVREKRFFKSYSGNPATSTLALSYVRISPDPAAELYVPAIPGGVGNYA